MTASEITSGKKSMLSHNMRAATRTWLEQPELKTLAST
jgi:hypothetical protein